MDVCKDIVLVDDEGNLNGFASLEILKGEMVVVDWRTAHLKIGQMVFREIFISSFLGTPRLQIIDS